MDRWELLAPYIGLGERDCTDIKKDNTVYQEQRLASLSRWRSKFGSRATVIALGEALYKIHRSDLVMELCKIHCRQMAEREKADSSYQLTVSKEYTTLLGCKNQLIDIFSYDLVTVCSKLLKSDLIPHSLADECQSKQKAPEIVNWLLNKVKSCPESFTVLLKVLSECHWMSDMVKVLSGDLTDSLNYCSLRLLLISI